MKLLNFVGPGETRERFGVVIDGYAVDFADLTKDAQSLASVASYCKSLPHSRDDAQTLVDAVSTAGIDAPRLEQVKILPSVPRPPALFDFGLSPRHLLNSAETMFKHEFGPLKRRVAAAVVKRKLSKMADSDVLPYYKGNHNAIIGDGDTIGWPTYSSYIDIEPELAVVYGNAKDPIAGYTVFNDISARDIQWPEMIGTGPTRSKDFDCGNALGPFLVTPEELPDPLNLDVKVRIGDRLEWAGSTSEYTHDAAAVIAYLSDFLTLLPGTVIGMGTIPDCTGLDNDEWVMPGETVTMEFTGLGNLSQHIPKPPENLQASRWEKRPFSP